MEVDDPRLAIVAGRLSNWFVLTLRAAKCRTARPMRVGRPNFAEDPTAGGTRFSLRVSRSIHGWPRLNSLTELAREPGTAHWRRIRTKAERSCESPRFVRLGITTYARGYWNGVEWLWSG